MHHHFAEQRIIKRTHLTARLHPAIAARPLRKNHLRQQPRTGPEILIRILRIHPRLNRMTLRHRRALRHHPIRIQRQPDHPLHQIHPRYQLRHSVLHLQPRVHLQEKEILPVRIINELHRARRPIRQALAQSPRRPMQSRPHLLRQPRRRRLFHHFLIPPLHRAITLAQRQHPPLAIAKKLHLHMPATLNEPLQKHRARPETPLAQSHHRLKLAPQLRLIPAHLHPDPPAARRALQHHRIT